MVVYYGLVSDFSSSSEELGLPGMESLDSARGGEGVYHHANEHTHNRPNRRAFVYFPFPVLGIAYSFPQTRARSRPLSHGRRIHSK